MNDERSLPPTARRRQDAQRAGEVAVSRDLVAAASLAAAWLVLVLGGLASVAGLVAYVHVGLAGATDGTTVAKALADAFKALTGALVWPLGAALVAALTAGVVQTRARLAPPRRLGASRVGLSSRRLLGREMTVEVVFDLFKIGTLLAIAAGSARTAMHACAALPHGGAGSTARALAGTAVHLGTKLVGAVVVLAVVDYGWRVLRHRDRLLMSHQEARREERETEGNPEQKEERRRRHRELLDAISVADRGTADLVLLDPGSLAVAVLWRRTGAAPVVVARAAGPQLPRFEQAARQAGVAVCIDPPLARALALTAEGAEIAERHYGALARAAARARAVASDAGETVGRDGRA